MWPHEPDEFDAHHIAPDDADHGDAWYFVFSRGELIVKSVQGAPEPVTADDFRWFDAEVHFKRFLGRFGSRSWSSPSETRRVVSPMRNLGEAQRW